VQEPEEKIPSRLPVLDANGEALFPFQVTTLHLPLPEAKALIDKVRECGGYLALGPLPGRNRRAASGPGTVALLLRVGPGREEAVTILVQGVHRARLSVRRTKDRTVRWADVEVIPEREGNAREPGTQALLRSVRDRVHRLSGTTGGFSNGVHELLSGVDDPGRFADLLSAQLAIPAEKARPLLEEGDPIDRLGALLDLLDQELEILSIQDRLNRHTRDEMDKRQRDFYLRQQLEAIHAELGEEDGGEGPDSYGSRLEKLSAPDGVKAYLEKEVTRLSRYSPFSEELSHVRSYLDLVLDLPWGQSTEDRLDLKRARRDLNRDHYGLKTVKTRILEHLAVTKLRGGLKGTLFCLVGPPGVGKTSLGRAVARTLGRRFVRMSLGGVRDESEIRGHRRTYIGALPGRIVQGIKNAGSMNPVFVLDEVDKMGADWRGDPSTALLEALDPEQNGEFVDHYLGFPFDLSRVMFIATANMLDGIHPALLDRMEILEIPGYTQEEKLAIAKKHILPREIVSHGLADVRLTLPNATLLALIRRYTREAGVRGLEKCIQSVLRRIARRVAEGGPRDYAVKPGELTRYVSQPPQPEDMRLVEDRVGIATGLAWTEVGGELLFVEATAVSGGGNLTLTGQMGEIMRESVQAALTYLKEHRGRWRIPSRAFSRKDIHVHVPEGAIPKDGPSAGVTMAVAMLSTLTGRPVRRKAAFSGEITLRGEVLPVGGLREKLLAAQRAGIRKVILPEANRSEKREIPRSVLKDLELVWVKTMDDLFPHALKP